MPSFARLHDVKSSDVCRQRLFRPFDVHAMIIVTEKCDANENELDQSTYIALVFSTPLGLGGGQVRIRKCRFLFLRITVGTQIVLAMTQLKS
jgi:hypothetical protein